MKGSQPDTTEQHSTSSLVSRRTFLQASAGAALATTAAGQAAAEETTEAPDEDVDLDFSSDYTHKPYTTETVTIAEADGDMGQLQYVADDGSVANYEDDGYVIARRPENDSDTPVAHNPVTLDAASIDGAEYTALPRGVQYDEDGDGDAETDVEWPDATHWSTTDSTNGTISLTEGDHDSLVISASSVPDGETVTATLDLSTVGDSDATITDGMSRKFLQSVADIGALPSGSSVDYALIDSAGADVTASYVDGGDTSADDVIAAATGSAVVGQPRVGDIEELQGVTLDDIQQVEIRINDGDAAITLHGLNVERETMWQYGQQEFVNSDDELETEAVETPSGEFSIVSLSSLRDGAFSEATVRDVTYDVEQRADKLPSEETLVRELDASRYDHDHRLEIVHRFEGPSAYDISRSISKFLDQQTLPSSRYSTVKVATGVGELEDWDDVDNVSWTTKGSNYDSLDKKIENLTGLAVADEGIVIKYELGLDGDRFDAMTGSSTAVAVGASSGGGGLGATVDKWKTVIVGGTVGLGLFFRNSLRSLLGGIMG